MSYVIKAVLSNPQRPECGQITVPFPIPADQYDHTIELLQAMNLGDSLKRDCTVDEVDSRCSVVSVLNGTQVNVDQLDYLAKRLDSFCEDEDAQFQAMAHKLGLTDIKDLINLTFCCQQATVITDFSDLEAIGRSHFMNLNGGCALTEELKNLDGTETALRLIDSGGGTVTPYGVAYDNGMKLRPLYTGGPFPAYGCGEPLVVAFKPQEGSEENFLFLPMAESRLYRVLERSGVIDPKNFELCYIDQAPMEEIISSLSLEKEDIFMLNRLAAALEELP